MRQKSNFQEVYALTDDWQPRILDKWEIEQILNMVHNTDGDYFYVNTSSGINS